LLQAWSAQYRVPATELPLYVMLKPEGIEQSIAAWCDQFKVRYALTQFSGAWSIVPMVRYQRSTVYIEDLAGSVQVDDLLQAIRASRVESGANLSLWLTRDSSVFQGVRKNFSGVNVVSPLQLYLDLRQQKGRGEEAAQEVLEREIKPMWESPDHVHKQ
jgi:hypothetical protein